MAITRDKKNDDDKDRDQDRNLSKVKLKSSEVTDNESIDKNTLIYNMERLRRLIVPAHERQGVMKNIFKTIKNNPTFNKDRASSPPWSVRTNLGVLSFRPCCVMKVLSVVIGGSLVLVRNIQVNLEAASVIRR